MPTHDDVAFAFALDAFKAGQDLTETETRVSRYLTGWNVYVSEDVFDDVRWELDLDMLRQFAA